MSKKKIINWFVLVLICVGLISLLNHFIVLSPFQAFEEIAEKVKYASIPLGLTIKLVQYFSAKVKKLEEIKEVTLYNKNKDELLQEQIKFVRDDLISFREEINNSYLNLDRRVVRVEARSELTTKLERQERLIFELTERFNQFINQ